MRERISMLLFRRLGIAAEREAFATLYVNNAYAGLYTIVESIDKDFAQRNFNDNDGYIYEYQYADPYYFEDRGRNPATYVPSPFEPQTHEDDPQPEKVGDLVQAINHAADFAAEMAQYLDLRTFIRHMAVLTFLADYDGFLGDFGMNNFYLYRFQNRNLFIIIPWDKSQALSSPTYSIWHNIRDVPSGQMNRLMTRALASPGLTSLYLDTLLETVASANEPGPAARANPGTLRAHRGLAAGDGSLHAASTARLLPAAGDVRFRWTDRTGRLHAARPRR